MIRRDGANDSWLLISQVDHAHLAAEIAAVWGNAQVPPLPHEHQLVLAVRDHDDGWQEWRRSPTIDPETGLPRNFTEMPMDVATAIWSQSIHKCRQHSPLAGLWVSEHFRFLGSMARETRDDGSEDATAIDEFLSQQQKLQMAWRNETEGESASNIDATIETGFRWVQFFDALSLWLCCAERTQPQQTVTPGGQTLGMTPLQPPSKIAFDPWPLSVARLELSVPAWSIPAKRLSDDAALYAAIRDADGETLKWELVPSA